MQKVTIQIPVSKELKISAEAAALEYGFSSLQEILRVIMKKIADRKLGVQLSEETTVKLSAKAERRYLKAMEDFKTGRNVYTAKNVDDLMQQLRSK